MPVEAADPTPVYVVGAYLVLLLGLGVFSSRLFKGTSSDYFVAGRSSVVASSSYSLKISIRRSAPPFARMMQIVRVRCWRACRRSSTSCGTRPESAVTRTSSSAIRETSRSPSTSTGRTGCSRTRSG